MLSSSTGIFITSIRRQVKYVKVKVKCKAIPVTGCGGP
jgi:hypothetical protein